MKETADEPRRSTQDADRQDREASADAAEKQKPGRSLYRAAGAGLLTMAAFGCGSGSPGHWPRPSDDTVDVPPVGYNRLAFNEGPYGPPPTVFPAHPLLQAGYRPGPAPDEPLMKRAGSP